MCVSSSKCILTFACYGYVQLCVGTACGLPCVYVCVCVLVLGCKHACFHMHACVCWSSFFCACCSCDFEYVV